MIDFLKKTCPNCGKLLSLNQLVKKPDHEKKLKWYQLNLNPTLYCPFCDQPLEVFFPKMFPLYFFNIFFYALYVMPFVGKKLTNLLGQNYQILIGIIIFLPVVILFYFFLSKIAINISWQKAKS